MSWWPPGIPFLLRYAMPLLAYSVIISQVLRLLSTAWGIQISSLFVWCTIVLSAPSFVAARIIFRYWWVARSARHAGAILPPRWIGKSFGHLDVLGEMMHSLDHGYPGDFAWPTFAEHGPIAQTDILWDRMYITCDPQVIKTILATDFDNFIKGEIFSGFMSPVLGTGVFNSDGEMWKWHRSMTRPFFSKDRISHFELFDKHSNEALRKMAERLSEGHAVDFQDLVSRFTLDCASEFLFGSCVDFLRSPLPFSHDATGFLSSSSLSPDTTSSAIAFAKAFQSAQHVCAQRSWRGWVWPLYETFEDKTSRHMRRVDQFFDPLIREALTRHNKQGSGTIDREDADSEDGTFLDNLVRYTSDPVVLHDEVLNILLAGRDTTASSLTFAVYLLCMYPAVLSRLRQEIHDVVGLSRRPTYEDIREMKYLRAVINETLRLYPPVPFNIRYSVKDCVIPNPDPKGPPIFVPANTPVSYYPFVMHRSTAYWGPDAMEFDPDRFLDDRLQKYLVPNPFIFLPFNAGPRICLGQQFAYNEISFFLIKLLQRFDTMELDLEAQPPVSRPPAEWAGAWGRKNVEKIWPKVHLTMYANGGLWVRMTASGKEDA
ncbi:cytochrome P450 [Laetiporus sulphureus 93-53]|uniref:Cytochrome P450 n=1 Tax=Laetiporus sulphureus 93-53 TaxID=1314785 RepID=A0A165AVD2_9APHY|nr:cytochrome P450 [Laetiporus sulphureus 93-53]KZS99736.1 cytochrome P450 [Laetiporus sulphureus 93-53]